MPSELGKIANFLQQDVEASPVSTSSDGVVPRATPTKPTTRAQTSSPQPPKPRVKPKKSTPKPPPLPRAAPASLAQCKPDWSLVRKAQFVQYHEKCGEMYAMGVVVGQTWGRLRSNRYGEWRERRCDQYARWHGQSGGLGTTKWGTAELLNLGGSSESECCAKCKANKDCGGGVRALQVSTLVFNFSGLTLGAATHRFCRL